MFPLENLPTPKIKENDLEDVPPRGRALTNGKSKYVDQIRSSGLHKEAVQAYLATTAYVDVQFGRVLSALESSKHNDNTIVVFLTDHGFHLGEKQHWQKNTLWEEATHSLLMIRTPGMQSAGQSCERFVSLQDIYPTLVELCELDAGNINGRSLVPLLNQPSSNWTGTAITAHTDNQKASQGFISLRDEAGRYIRYESGQEEFYAASDPKEWTNLIDHPDFSQTINQYRNRVPSLDEMARPLPEVIRKKK